MEHKNAVHAGIRFPCDHCDHIASSKRNLRGHMGRKHPTKELPVTYNTVTLNEEEREKERIKNSHKSHHFKIKNQTRTKRTSEPEHKERNEIMTTEESALLICPHCTHTDESKDILIQHMNNKHQEKPRPTSFMSIKGSTIPQPRPKSHSNQTMSDEILLSLWNALPSPEFPASEPSFIA